MTRQAASKITPDMIADARLALRSSDCGRQEPRPDGMSEREWLLRLLIGEQTPLPIGEGEAPSVADRKDVTFKLWHRHGVACLHMIMERGGVRHGYTVALDYSRSMREVAETGIKRLDEWFEHYHPELSEEAA